MKKTVKAMALLLCAVIVVCVSALGTLAYLTFQTETANNTFVTGKVMITLLEYKINSEGKAETGTLVNENKDIKLVPGRIIEKQPFITVDPASEECYLFVKVEDDLTAYGTITWVTGWTELKAGSGIWYYNATDNAGKTVKVFESFICSNTVTDYAGFTGAITVTAYAVQAEGFADAKTAWANTYGALANP